MNSATNFYPPAIFNGKSAAPVIPPKMEIIATQKEQITKEELLAFASMHRPRKNALITLCNELLHYFIPAYLIHAIEKRQFLLENQHVKTILLTGIQKGEIHPMNHADLEDVSFTLTEALYFNVAGYSNFFLK